MKKEKAKKQIPVRVVTRGDARYGHHAVHQCDMGRQLGRPVKPVTRFAEASG